MREIVCGLAIVVVTVFPLRVSADELKVIPAAEASRHVDKVVTIEMTVRSTGSSRKEGFVFLNTHQNYRSNENFALVFTPEAQSAFRKAGIDNIEKHYFKKVIQVTGKVRHFKSITDMQIEKPEQIRVIGTAASDPSTTTPPELAEADTRTRTSTPVQPVETAEQSPLTNPYVYGSIALLGVGLLAFGVGLLVMFRKRQT